MGSIKPTETFGGKIIAINGTETIETPGSPVFENPTMKAEREKIPQEKEESPHWPSDKNS
jgi:hypothetical protein